jgi:hypothetical protein
VIVKMMFFGIDLSGYTTRSSFLWFLNVVQVIIIRTLEKYIGPIFPTQKHRLILLRYKEY